MLSCVATAGQRALWRLAASVVTDAPPRRALSAAQADKVFRMNAATVNSQSQLVLITRVRSLKLVSLSSKAAGRVDRVRDSPRQPAQADGARRAQAVRGTIFGCGQRGTR